MPTVNRQGTMDDVIALRLGPGPVVAARSLREKFLDVMPDLVLDMLKIPPTGRFIDGCLVRVEQDAIPMDAKAVRCGITPNGDIRIVLESQEFPPVEERAVMPQISPRYSMTREVARKG